MPNPKEEVLKPPLKFGTEIDFNLSTHLTTKGNAFYLGFSTNWIGEL